MNPFEIAGYVVLGFVPTLIAMKIGWDLASKKILLTYPKRYETYEPVETVSLSAEN